MSAHLQYIQYFDSPFGCLKISSNGQGITAIGFVDTSVEPQKPDNHTQAATEQLGQYFAGQRAQFSLSLKPKGTAFQQQVWEQLQKIPYGQTCSYAHIAQQIDNPKAVRAVGAANGRNPITIVVPCHRVIGSNGKLTGYAWGTSIKAGLLTLENACD